VAFGSSDRYRDIAQTCRAGLRSKSLIDGWAAYGVGCAEYRVTYRSLQKLDTEKWGQGHSDGVGQCP
jgi:hypothetical protein